MLQLHVAKNVNSGLLMLIKSVILIITFLKGEMGEASKIVDGDRVKASINVLVMCGTPHFIA